MSVLNLDPEYNKLPCLGSSLLCALLVFDERDGPYIPSQTCYTDKNTHQGLRIRHHCQQDKNDVLSICTVRKDLGRSVTVTVQ